MLFRVWNEIRESVSVLTAVGLQKLSINYIFIVSFLFAPFLSLILLQTQCTLTSFLWYIDEFRTVLINDSILLSLVSIQLKVVPHRTVLVELQR